MLKVFYYLPFPSSIDAKSMLNVVQMQLKNNLMVLTHHNWNPMKCLFTPRACNLLFGGANLSYSCPIILFTLKGGQNSCQTCLWLFFTHLFPLWLSKCKFTAVDWWLSLSNGRCAALLVSVAPADTNSFAIPREHCPFKGMPFFKTVQFTSHGSLPYIHIMSG